MITAQDIREKTFEKATFGGYAMGEVDDFLDALAGDVAAAQKENTTLRGKMKVLVDKIEEYRESEDAMRLALVSAQKVAKTIQDDARTQADEMLANARAEAERLISDAHAQADAVLGDLVHQRETEELRLQKAQAAAAEYVQKFRMVLEHEGAFLDSLEDSDFIQDVIVTPAPDEKKAIAAPAEEPAEEAEPQPEEPAEEPAEEAEPVEAAEPAEPAQAADEDDLPDFFKAPKAEPAEEAPADDYVTAFEKAVYSGAEDAIPPAADGDDAPTYRF